MISPPQDADASEIKVQVCVYAFDLLYLNGESLVKKTFRERRQLLRDNFKEVEGEFTFATAMDSKDTDEIGEFLEESIKGMSEYKVLNIIFFVFNLFICCLITLFSS